MYYLCINGMVKTVLNVQMQNLKIQQTDEKNE